MERGGNEVADQIAVLANQIAILADQVSDMVWWLRIFAGLTVLAIAVTLAVLQRLIRVERWQTDHGGPIERLGHEQEAADVAQAFARRNPHHSGTSERPH